MKSHWLHLVACMHLLFGAGMTLAQSDRLEAARRHMVRGGAAVEMAIANKSPGDMQDAAREFRKATEIAPEMALAWFNLGAVESKLGRYAEAIEAYRRYLQLSPKAEDAAKIGNEVIKLEFLQERSQAKQRLAGTWVVGASGTANAETYQIRFDDEKFVMTPSSRSWLAREISLFNDKREPDHKNSFKAGGAQLFFEGRVVGERIAGERIQPKTAISFDEEQPLCGIQEHRVPFEGKLENDGATLTLSFNEPRYRVYWGYIGSFLALGTDKSCRAVEEVKSEQVVLHLARQQPLANPVERQTSQTAPPPNARDYVIRGGMALEAAKSDADLILAEAEFRKATSLDPQLADAWYNLGLLYTKLKKYPDAVAAYQKYLEVQPAAGNAQKVRDEVTRLQYFQERQPEIPQPGWTFLAKKSSGDRQGDTVHIDRSTIKSQNGITSVVVLFDYATPPTGGWDFNSQKQVHEISCELRQGRRISVNSYEGRMGEGKLLYQYTKPDQDFYSADTSGSLGKLLIEAVCR